MDLETVIQDAVSQKVKNKYCVLIHICGIWKKLSRPFYLLSINRDSDGEDVCMDIKGERQGWEKLKGWDYILLYIKQIVSENLLRAKGTLLGAL